MNSRWSDQLHTKPENNRTAKHFSWTWKNVPKNPPGKWRACTWSPRAEWLVSRSDIASFARMKPCQFVERPQKEDPSSRPGWGNYHLEVIPKWFQPLPLVPFWRTTRGFRAWTTLSRERQGKEWTTVGWAKKMGTKQPKPKTWGMPHFQLECYKRPKHLVIGVKQSRSRAYSPMAWWSHSPILRCNDWSTIKRSPRRDTTRPIPAEWWKC